MTASRWERAIVPLVSSTTFFAVLALRSAAAWLPEAAAELGTSVGQGCLALILDAPPFRNETTI